MKNTEIKKLNPWMEIFGKNRDSARCLRCYEVSSLNSGFGTIHDCPRSMWSRWYLAEETNGKIEA